MPKFLMIGPDSRFKLIDDLPLLPKLILLRATTCVPLKLRGKDRRYAWKR
jgi:hypothetical protein